ncbi:MULTISPECIES: ribosomal protection-like ABC-F family protein [Aerococcus]|uniref:ribosomal protection-like ABC-F family protein n=1 Tax=Aerococcus urinae (strain CCUG 59500 / ACS-120-V-Col10a) TaxID=2976812 RepID=UPI000200F3DA|nr:ATP-binding cassette domain-containing protein [Aerococcus sp. Group 1]AEA01445.1 ABC transporter, ATP-binding protein [Aerococcus sp. Group 1]MCY3030337.1 ATP-binding cassette domain-containing protein [Aerococcus sp. Group 1]MCY3055434.1 ATP-binding cassette domain-containing protein [Aerococcus sp. Group 1]MCY3057164.1 ATP-binding cassette domain-containing protein [Aerococcus sp. Group 1]MCY3061526.1 ATP-binding cassette domain-containing protein [Aerococcus sp. Group 1]
MEVIKLLHVSKMIADRQLFQIDQLIANQGDKIGLIGKNGVGKSTLLGMLAGLDQEYIGQIIIHQSYAYLPQLKKTTIESGGEQEKRMLEEAFNKRAALLILDEPTSNLDVENIDWLTQTLEKYSGTVLMVSHDRHLLNQVVDQIWELDQGKVTKYVGNYDDYQRAKTKAIQGQEVAYKNYQKKVHQLEEEIQERNLRAQNFKKKKKNLSRSDYKVSGYAGKYDGQQKGLARSAKALKRRIDQLDPVARPKKERQYRFKAVGNLAVKAGQSLLGLEAGQVHVGERLLFTFPEFKLQAGDKVAIQGPNQAGKTTFLGQLFHHQLSGYYRENLNIGYFRQNFDQLHLNKSILENVSEDSLQSNGLIHQVLGSLGFKENKLSDKVKGLSGGERVRLAFAKLLLGDYHLLLLDEPTNYLDIQTLESVEHFIRSHPAAILLVSHDQEFVNHCADKQYVIKHKKLLSPSYQKDNQDKREKEISRLEFRLNQMIADKSVGLEEIREVQNKIKRLKEKGKMK